MRRAGIREKNTRKESTHMKETQWRKWVAVAEWEWIYGKNKWIGTESREVRLSARGKLRPIHLLCVCLAPWQLHVLCSLVTWRICYLVFSRTIKYEKSYFLIQIWESCQYEKKIFFQNLQAWVALKNVQTKRLSNDPQTINTLSKTYLLDFWPQKDTFFPL